MFDRLAHFLAFWSLEERRKKAQEREKWLHLMWLEMNIGFGVVMGVNAMHDALKKEGNGPMSSLANVGRRRSSAASVVSAAFLFVETDASQLFPSGAGPKSKTFQVMM